MTSPPAQLLARRPRVPGAHRRLIRRLLRRPVLYVELIPKIRSGIVPALTPCRLNTPPPLPLFARRSSSLALRAYEAAPSPALVIREATVQAANLPRTLATGLINAFMTSSATGYDSRAWEFMTYFYDA
jgi:hypothetical protein